MTGALSAVLCRTFDGKPLAVVDGLPGGCAELTPDQLRALAGTLLRIAADADARPMGRAYARLARQYGVTNNTTEPEAP